MDNKKLTSVQKDYTDPDKRGSFAGLPEFLRATGRKNSKKIRDELSAIPSYSLFKPVRTKYKQRATVVPPYLHYSYGMDLMSVQNMARKNKGINYILITVDLFSRFIFTAYLKRKDMTSVREGIEKCFRESGHTPRFVLTDEVCRLSFVNLLANFYFLLG